MVKEAVKKIDTTESGDDTQVRGWYKQLMSKVYEIDDALDAQSDTGGKRKFTNKIVEETKSGWEPVVQNLIAQMSEMSEEELAGSFYGIVRDLTDAYKETIDNWMAKEIENQPKVEVDSMSDEEKKALQETRQNVNKQIRAIIEMAYTFGEAHGDMNAETAGEGDDQQDPNWPFPKVRRGSVGARGKRALSLYTWTIDGEGLGEDDDSVKGVATLLGYEKVADFTKALREDPDPKINTTNPPDEFTKTLRDKVVTGTRITEEDDAEEDDPTEPNGEEE